MPEWWERLRGREEPQLPPVYVGSHEHKLMRIPRLHVDPDDDAMTREDKARARAYATLARYPLRPGR
jgi:hypothetical protein